MTTLRAAFPRLVLGLLIAAVTVWLAFNRDRPDPALIESAIHHFGFWAPLGHIVLFSLGTILFVPGAIFGLLGGALFGPLWGTMLNLAGATLGATAAFLVARYVGSRLGQTKGGRPAQSPNHRGRGGGLALRCLRAARAVLPVQPHQLRAWPHSHFL